MRQKLDLTSEQRKQYHRDKSRESVRRHRQRAEREAYKGFVKLLLSKIEELGWSRPELMLGEDSGIVESIVDGMIADPRFQVIVSSKKLRYYKNMGISGEK